MYAPGGYPSQGGLAGLAQQLQSRGRGEDSMLVHMTPKEVGGLQSLARAAGGSLTTNPDTGLPEAGFLGKILPMIAGGLLNLIAPGIGSLGAAALVGGTTGAIKGDLGAGLMAGLGAFGGFGLGGALQNLGTAGAQTAGTAGTEAAAQTAGQVAGQGVALSPGTEQILAALPDKLAATSPVTGSIVPTASSGLTMGTQGALDALTPAFEAANAPTMGALPSFAVNTPLASTLGVNSPFLSNFETALGGAAGPTLTRSGLGAAGVAGGLLGAMQGGGGMGKAPGMGGDPRWRYEGPYTMGERRAVFPGAERGAEDTSEFNYFRDPIQYFKGSGEPYIPGTPAAPLSKKEQKFYDKRGYLPYAEGGPVPLRDGSFVLDARTVSEVGNGSSGAGQEVLSRLGGKPIRGPGDGVSDSIPASIGGGREARVARDEVKFDPEAVARLGKGDTNRGAKKLYALMDKAHKARKKAKRGQDTKVRKGLV